MLWLCARLCLDSSFFFTWVFVSLVRYARAYTQIRTHTRHRQLFAMVICFDFNAKGIWVAWQAMTLLNFLLSIFFHSLPWDFAVFSMLFFIHANVRFIGNRYHDLNMTFRDFTRAKNAKRKKRKKNDFIVE